MTLTYIFHSGFVLETEQSILLFDYWMDPSGVMDGVLRSEKPMYVFSSHFHEDHFTKEIFEWKKQREGITYILSKDIYKHRRANKEDADVWLAKGGSWSDDNISVWALGSTDSGVSWIVEMEGERYSFEMEEVFNPIAHEKQFLGELKDIRKVADSFDVVMFPIDGRVGRSSSARLLPEGRKNGYTLGGRQFIERFKVGLFVPMHFTTGFEPSEQREQSRTCSNYAESRERKSGAQSSWRMKEFTDEKGIPFWEINREGETIGI